MRPWAWLIALTTGCFAAAPTEEIVVREVVHPEPRPLEHVPAASRSEAPCLDSMRAAAVARWHHDQGYAVEADDLEPETLDRDFNSDREPEVALVHRELSGATGNCSYLLFFSSATSCPTPVAAGNGHLPYPIATSQAISDLGWYSELGCGGLRGTLTLERWTKGAYATRESIECVCPYDDPDGEVARGRDARCPGSKADETTVCASEPRLAAARSMSDALGSEVPTDSLTVERFDDLDGDGVREQLWIANEHCSAGGNCPHVLQLSGEGCWDRAANLDGFTPTLVATDARHEGALGVRIHQRGGCGGMAGTIAWLRWKGDRLEEVRRVECGCPKQAGRDPLCLGG